VTPQENILCRLFLSFILFQVVQKYLGRKDAFRSVPPTRIPGLTLPSTFISTTIQCTQERRRRICKVTGTSATAARSVAQTNCWIRSLTIIQAHLSLRPRSEPESTTVLVLGTTIIDELETGKPIASFSACTTSFINLGMLAAAVGVPPPRRRQERLWTWRAPRS
jgi:hypothetical protein